MDKIKVRKIFKVLIALDLLIIIGLLILYLIEANNQTMSFFTKHFSLPIILVLVGVVALFLPVVSSKSIAGESKGDSMMIWVGFLLIICAIFSLIFSFMSL